MIEKRKNPAMTDSEMYELSSIKEFKIRSTFLNSNSVPYIHVDIISLQ